MSDIDIRGYRERDEAAVIRLWQECGLVMPIVLDIEFEDGSHEELRIPAEIWRRNNQSVAKLIVTEQPIKSLVLDPHLETADVDLSNNYFPPRIEKSRFQLFKSTRQSRNEMQRAQAEKKAADKKAADKKAAAEKAAADKKATAEEKAADDKKAAAEKKKQS